MIGNTFVIDGVAHALDFSDSNKVEGVPIQKLRDFTTFAYSIFMGQIESRESGYLLTPEEYNTRFTAEDLAHIFFVESDVDIIVAHAVDIKPLFINGVFRWDTHAELKRLAPERVLLYAAVDTFDEDRERIFDDMEQKVSEGAVGFKFYPSNGMFDKKANKLVSLFYDDPENAYPLFEKALQLGVKTVAFHKAQPVGVGPNTVVGVEDISTAAAAFPDLTFEVVHTGWAFLEDSAYQLAFHNNVYANLENTFGLINNQPRRFAHIIGTLLRTGSAEQLIYASGCALNHPDPQIRAFMDFQIPEDLRDGYGYPELTPEIKSKILGENIAKVHGIDIEKVKKNIQNDEWSHLRVQGKPEPWSAFRTRINSH